MGGLRCVHTAIKEWRGHGKDWLTSGLSERIAERSFIGTCGQDIISLCEPSHDDVPDPGPETYSELFEEPDPFCIGDEEHFLTPGFDSG